MQIKLNNPNFDSGPNNGGRSKIGSIQRSLTPDAGTKKLIIFCGDHGIAEDNVSLFKSSDTKVIVDSLLRGRAAINSICDYYNIPIQIVNVGMKDTIYSTAKSFNKNINFGTKNIIDFDAMSMDDCESAIKIGEELAKECIADGNNIIGIGEIGIGNTTAASAIFSVICDLPVKNTTGYGTGISEGQYKMKIKKISEAIENRKPNKNEPLQCLQKLGGYEIAAMVGVILYSASRGIPVVVDGFASSISALIAHKLNKHVLSYLFFSHLSEEKGHQILLDMLNVEYVLDLKMKLGEGTGSAIALPIIDLSCKMLKNIKVF